MKKGFGPNNYIPSAYITTQSISAVFATGVVMAAVFYYLWQVPEKTIGEQRKILSSYLPPVSASDIEELRAGVKEERIPYKGDAKKPVGVSLGDRFDFGEERCPSKRYFLRYYFESHDVSTKSPITTVIFAPGTAFLSREEFSARICRDWATRRPDLQVIMINPRLAPEFPFPIPHDDAKEMVQFLLDNAERYNIDCQNIIFAGYSSGGNFALNMALTFKSDSLLKIRKLILVSPFLNFNISDAEMFLTNFWDSKSLARGFVKQFIFAYAGAHPRDDFRLSPILRPDTDFRGLPPTVVIVGVSDYVAGDARRLVTKLQGCGVLEWVDNSAGNVGHGALWKLPDAVVGMMVGAMSDINTTPTAREGDGPAVRRVDESPNLWRRKSMPDLVLSSTPGNGFGL